MRFLLDEGADLPLAAFLRQQGHDVTAIAQDYPSALSDREVLAIARQERRVLVTNDRDFGELIVRHRVSHSGVIFLRLGEESVATKIARLTYVLTHFAGSMDQFLVVTNRAVRVRRKR